MLNHLDQYISVLFNDDEWVNAATSSVREITGRRAGDVRGQPTWVCINPLKLGTTRKQANVSERRNFLVEFDYLTPEQQWDMVRQADMPVSTAVHSGNKSIHFVIALEVGLSAELYRSIAEALRQVVPECDKSCLESARLTRCPNDMQELVYSGGRFTYRALYNWLVRSDKVAKASKVPPRGELGAPIWVRTAKMTLRTMQYIAGQLDSGEMHAASIHAVRNMFELGSSRESIILTVATVRQSSMNGECAETSDRKAAEIVEWVEENWAQ